jgi:23S rRNA (cytosine1962-C5)-methyltransferase
MRLYFVPERRLAAAISTPCGFFRCHRPKGEDLVEGETVRVLAADGVFLGVGHFQIGSIAVRIMSFVDEPIDAAFYKKSLSNAYRMRSSLNLVRPDNTIFRLVHGEGDCLPGLIVDIYGDTAVIQSHSVGIHRESGIL